MKANFFLSSILILFLFANVFAYETYDISESDLDSRYTKDLSPGDRINFPIGNNDAYVTVNSVGINYAKLSIFAYADSGTNFYSDKHSNKDLFPPTQKFEMTEDNYYDLQITLNSAVMNEDGTRVANLTLEKIHEKIPEGAGTYYACWDYFECPDGTKIKKCDYDDQGSCVCRGISFSECEPAGGEGGQNDENKNEITCIDNDGLDYFTKSETIVQKKNSKLKVADQCLIDLRLLADQYPTYKNILNNMISEGVLSSSDVENKNILVEAYCPSNTTFNFNAPHYQKSHICSKGCIDGVCMNDDTPADECETIGFRLEGKYCSPNSTLESQKDTSFYCENHFECSSNLCINAQCISGSLWSKFMKWLGEVFG
jgi:hypothetical protein